MNTIENQELSVGDIYTADIAASMFIASLSGSEAGIYTIRKAFMMGYLSGLQSKKEINNDI
jgi:hypothetical protein